MIFIVLFCCIEICFVIECCDFDVGLIYCMVFCVIYVGFFNVFLVVDKFNYEGLFLL